MAGETILIIDADGATEQKIMTVLEAKGYLVFTASSQVLNAETLEKLGPSLIYIASVTPGGAGLKTCKTIHGNQSLKQVPIVLLGSPEGSPDLQNLTGDGVVDFLKLPFGSDELIKKTETILGTTSPSHLQKGNGWGVEKTASDPRPTPRASTTENDLQVNEWESIDRALSEKHKRTAVSEPWNDVEEDQEGQLKDESLWPETAGSVEKKRSAHHHQPAMGATIFRALLRPAIGVAILVVIVGAGILVYQQFAPAPKVWPVRPASTPPPAPPKPREARPELQLPPGKIAESVPTPSSPASQISEPPASAPAAPAPAASPVSTEPARTAPVPSAGPRTPSSPAELAPQPPAKPFYSVQIGAYRDEANAQDLAKKFLDKGYDVFVQAGVTKDKSSIYRVLVSKSEDKRTARKLAEEIRSKEKIQTTLFGD
jgi:DNA-binding response OmpR family regulator/cell division septation protein DedD